MKWVEKIVKIVDEVVEFVLKELKILCDKVEIVVIDEGLKGILGIIGVRFVKVKVIVK